MFIYSVIIPHRNCPKLLRRCVDSIPVREDIQIIVVDDNSDEGKKPSLSGRKGLEIVLLDASQSKGAGHARNVGLKHAKGKWLLFADADDYYKEGFLDVLDEYKGQNLDILYFNFEYRDGETLDELEKLPFRSYFDDYDGSALMEDNIRYHHNVPWTKMVNRELIQQKSIFFEEVPNGNDIFFSMSVGYHARTIAVEKRPLYVYLKNENSIITSKHKSVSSHLCKIVHVIKQNEWYDFIGHKEWKKPVLHTLLIHIKSSGIKLLFTIVKKSPMLLFSRKEWITLICK